MRKTHLLSACGLITLILAAGAAYALPPGYNRNLARQQLANMAQVAYAKKMVTLQEAQSMGVRLATSDRFVDDHVNEMQRVGVDLGTPLLGTSGAGVLDAITAAQAAVSGRRTGVSTTVTPGVAGPTQRADAQTTVTNAQNTLTGSRNVTAPALTSVTERTRTPGRDNSMISDVDNPGIWDWLTKSDADMQAEWDKKYGPKPPCGDDGDVMCGYRFTGGGASRPNPEGNPRRALPTDLTANDVKNPRNGSHVTNPAPDDGTGATAGVDRTAPIPTLPGGGVVNPGGPENVRTPVKVDGKVPIIDNTNVINPDRSNGNPTEPGQAGGGAQGNVGTPGGKKNE
ncbi:hypothetical protein PQU94_08340 [Asticcacaulis sp. DXS10W]|uniref:Uncharacterized protein n=1 Tax=Asticcacaulis currens TaxID=2984210 RepID=A0ABT5IE90_9CAUL|nr:hypothetical protein [Asticcacaulis currens]MDC7694287.1 hypothetical protein [Asticcacaulis currens]